MLRQIVVSLLGLVWAAASYAFVILPHPPAGQDPAIFSSPAKLQAELKGLKQNEQRLLQTIGYQAIQLSQTQKQIKQVVQKIHTQHIKTTQTGFAWVAASESSHVAHALVVEKTTMGDVYLCQAPYAGNRYPGTLTVKGCLITYGGQAYTIAGFKVLTAQKPISWVAGSLVGKAPRFYFNSPVVYRPIMPFEDFTSMPHPAGAKPKQAYAPILGGFEDGHYLYVCRIMLNGMMHFGKVVGGSCLFPYANKEASMPGYQVLVAAPKK